MTSIQDQERAERRERIALLRTISPAEMKAASEAATLEAFARAIAQVPAYRELYAQSSAVPPDQIVTIDGFRREAPLLDKHVTFGRYDVRDLCLGGSLDGVRSFLTSSGHSGVFSFGVNTAENLSRSANSIDMGLEYVFRVDSRRTLLINALPMGVKVNTKATVLAETSVRDDMVFALVKKLAVDFDQILIVAEGSFAKKILEDGAELHGIDWKSLPVSLIVGEEGIAENYRDYICELLGISDPTCVGGKLVMSSMGVAELDLNIFHETPDTIAIRRLAHRDPALRRALFGEETKVCPMFFAYYPQRCYVEEVVTGASEPELVVSMLSAEMKIPLLRYRSGDLGRIFEPEQVIEILARFGHRLQPDLNLPFVAVYGRGQSIAGAHGALSPEEVKEAIYADAEIAGALTGNFRLIAAANGTIEIALQIRDGKAAPPDASARLASSLKSISAVPVTPRFLPFENFPYNMQVDWERKFRYI